jgi:hypothetical protein
MELLIVLAYVSLCIAVFALLRIPLTRVSVPIASIGGIMLTFSLVQVLNFYHPWTDASDHYMVSSQIASDAVDEPREVLVTIDEPYFVAWFNQSSRFRIVDGAEAEVTFDSIPGKVFKARVHGVLPTRGGHREQAVAADAHRAADQPGIPVLIDITDPRFRIYEADLPGLSHAQAAIYGENLQQLSVLRKTLLRMSAWLNFLSPIG